MNLGKYFGLLLLIFLFMTQCTFFESTKKTERALEHSLSRVESEYRAKIISNVKYALNMDLTNQKIFFGQVKINFNLSDVKPLNIDFRDGTIKSILINSESAKFKYNNFFISLEAANLKKGLNEVIVEFSHPYSLNGSGLYRFKDPLDERVYIYSDFEPYDASLMFPCFDQPDLKANYKLSVTAPKSWVVVSSQRESSVDVNGEMSRWIFPDSEKFSTYLISLHAGEYKVWDSSVQTKTQKIPMRLMARQSLSQYVKPDDWFTYLGSALKFYEDYFSSPYPYKKYDQIIVPDFNSGAMENVAAVTFNENRFIARGAQSFEQKRRLASVIFHEAAHMWFGNLVTMKWWNDLWLNESFATFMSYKGLVAATEFKNNWLHFLTSEKPSAHEADQMPTTHPIEADVSSTAVAFTNFDDISYDKGASVLKQLSFYIGEDSFQKSLKEYFKKFANQNTERSDFTNVIGEVSGKNMEDWSKKWLQTPHFNTVEVNASCSDGKISQFNLMQSFSQNYPTLRTHKMKIASFYKTNNTINIGKVVDLEYSAPVTEVKEFIGERCPDVALPNFEDHDYVKVVLDAITVKNVKENLSLFEDPMIRTLFWNSLWDMVSDQKLKAQDFLELVFSHGLRETDLEVLSLVLGRVGQTLNNYFPEDSEDWRNKRLQVQNSFEAAYLLKIKNTKNNLELQKIWYREFVAMAETNEAQDILVKILNGSFKELVFDIDQDKRWDILQKLSELGYAEALTLVDIELAKDPSATGSKRSTQARSLFPHLENKKRVFAIINQGLGADLSLGNMRAMMSGFYSDRQKLLLKEFEPKILQKVSSFGQSDGVDYVREYLRYLLPLSCTTKTILELNQVSKGQKLPILVEKMIKNYTYLNEKCVNIQNYAKKAM